MRSFGSLTNTLLSVGMEEVEEDNKVCKLSYLPYLVLLSYRNGSNTSYYFRFYSPLTTLVTRNQLNNFIGKQNYWQNVRAFTRRLHCIVPISFFHPVTPNEKAIVNHTFVTQIIECVNNWLSRKIGQQVSFSFGNRE